MIQVRRARPADAPSIGAVHVAAWRSAYPGLLPDSYLSRLSAPRQAIYYDRIIRGGGLVHVATASALDLAEQGSANGGSAPRVVAFATSGRAREVGIAEGEIETLYVLDDWRERGLGRRLMRAAAQALQERGCRSAYVWVLRDNPSRWFYARLGGKPVAHAMTEVAGVAVPQTAYLWDPIERLALASSPTA